MANQTAAFFDQWQTDQLAIRDSAPELAKAFGAMFQSIMKEGALSIREKELINMSVGLAVRCKPCINLHVEKCLKAGATREQILEAAGVTVMMQGGPSFTHVPEVIHALDHLQGRR